MLRVGIVGCGAIGSDLAKTCDQRFKRLCQVAYLCDLHPDKAQHLARKLKSRPAVVSLTHLVRKSDFVIEAASVSCVSLLVREVLRRGKSVLVMSVGGLVLDRRWRHTLKTSQGELFLPSGAIAGVDALLAARQGHIRKVTLTTRKPWKAFDRSVLPRGFNHPARSRRRDVLLFEGNAYEAIQRFPQNVNVAGTVSLAGLGPEKTRVKIYASSGRKVNCHELVVEGDFGRIETRVQNTPSAKNPKTSLLAILSPQALLEKIFRSLRLGT